MNHLSNFHILFCFYKKTRNVRTHFGKRHAALVVPSDKKIKKAEKVVKVVKVKKSGPGRGKYWHKSFASMINIVH